MNESVKNWYAYANRDLTGAEEILNKTEQYGFVAIICQQSVEKFLKLFLAAHNIPIVKIHDLVKLNAVVNKVKDFGFDEDILKSLSELYSKEKYPSEGDEFEFKMPTKVDAKRYFNFAKNVAQKIIGYLESVFPEE
ncbi:MAG: HEPN domain-containing protein [Planctomycetaceae bacterium]|jgi:HEPN domain-containing protein|nr:HEPN domain-containing protein [Planctomycetaceae bacterium]